MGEAFVGAYAVVTLFGTLAPFLAFLLLAVLADSATVTRGVSRLHAVLKDVGAGAVSVAAVYVICGFVVGKIVGAFGVWLTRAATRLPRVGQRYSYAAWYARQRAPIEQLYRQLSAGLPAFELSLTDKVNALKSYYAPVHPEGLAAVQRQFLLVDITRAAFVYSAILLVNEALSAFPRPGLALLCAAIVVIAAAATSRRIEKVVRTEMVFLVAAARIKADAAAAPPAS